MADTTTKNAVDDDEFDESEPGIEGVPNQEETQVVKAISADEMRISNLAMRLVDEGKWNPEPEQILERVRQGKVTPERLRSALVKAGKSPDVVDKELKLFKEFAELQEVKFEFQTHEPQLPVTQDTKVAVTSQIPNVGNTIVPFQLKRAAQQPHYINMLLHGPAGVGKTSFAGSCADVPEMRDVLYVDAEGGTVPISDRDIDIIPVRDWTQFARIEQFIALHCRLREANDIEKLCQLESIYRGEKVTEPRRYHTVVIDSITEVQKYCMYHLLGVEVGTQALDMDWDNPEFKEWGQAAELIRLLARKLRDMPINVIFCALDQRRENEKKQQEILPALPGKLAREFPGFFDVTGYLAVGEASVDDGKGGKIRKEVRRLLIQPTANITAKNRLADDTIKFIDNPTMADLLKVATKLHLKGNA